MSGDAALTLGEALELGVALRLRPVLADLRGEVLAEYGAGQAGEISPAAHAATLAGWTQRQLERIASLHAMAEAFNGEVVNAYGEEELQAAILTFAEQMGAKSRQLRRDRMAFARFFDADAVLERYRRRVGERERAVVYGLDRLSWLVARSLGAGEIDAESPLLADTVSALLRQARAYRGERRVRQAAYRALRVIAEGAPVRLVGFWVDLALRDMQRVALDGEEDAWSQCEALSCLLALSPQSLTTVFDRRLTEAPGHGSPQRQDNRIFVRRHIARMICGAVAEHPRLARYLARLSGNEDGAVRQALAHALPQLPGNLMLPLFDRLADDADAQVRAALLADPVAMAGTLRDRDYLEHLLRVFQREEDEFVLRLAMASAVEFAAWQLAQDESRNTQPVMRLRAALTRLRLRSDNIKVKRWAGEARERLWLVSDAEASGLAEVLSDAVEGLREGRSRRVGFMRELLAENPAKVGRVLAVLAIEEFGFDLAAGKRPTLRRGDRFATKLWRLLHELRISASDKRQAFRHTIGRAVSGG